MSAYYPQIDCVLIDADGERTAAASLTFDIYNVTTSTSEGTTTSNTSGIIASASLGVSDGDILEFSHGTYPGVYRCVAKTLQSSAFSDQGNYGLTYVVENLQTPEDADQAVLIAIDTNSPDARPITLGKALGGTTTDFLVDKSSVSRTWRIYPVSQRKDGSFSQPEYTTLTSTEYEDVTISAFTLGGLAGTQTAATFFAGPVSGSAATPTFRAISMSDLGTGTPSSSNFLRGDGSWQTVATGLTINSTAISSGTSGALLFQNSSNQVSQDATRLFWDDSNDRLGVNTNSPSANVHVKAKNDSDDVMFVDGTASQSGYLFRAGKNGNGNYFRIDKDGNIDAIGGVNTRIRGASGKVYFPDGITVTNWESNSASGDLRADSYGYPFRFFGLADVRVLTILAYSSQTVNVVEIANSSGTPKISVDANFNLVFADAGNIAVGTSTGTKIGTSTSQKLGFFNATPVTQRADIGALTDSTGGTPGTTIQDVGGAFDQGTLNDNFASLAAQINALRTEQRDLGFMA